MPANTTRASLFSVRLEDWYWHWNCEPPLTGRPTCKRCKGDFQVTWTDYIVVSYHLRTINDNHTLVNINWDIFLKTVCSKLRRGNRPCPWLQCLLSLPWINIRHACCMWLVGIWWTLHCSILSIFCRISETLQHKPLLFLTTTAEVLSWTASK